MTFISTTMIIDQHAVIEQQKATIESQKQEMAQQEANNDKKVLEKKKDCGTVKPSQKDIPEVPCDVVPPCRLSK